MKENDEGFLYPSIDVQNCINCGLCTKTCMVDVKSEAVFEKKAYAMSNKDDAVRNDSSSGGVFTLIAEYVISNGGVVYGAAFDEQYNVEHIRISKQSDIWRVRSSKYVQSRIGDCYIQAKKDLDAGLKVLFTGTPCQIAGLKGYLKKDYDNLLCQDVMCHGVPSPKLWRKYLSELNIGKICNISFRDKITGWSQYSVRIEGKEGLLREQFYKNAYMKAFLEDIVLRMSCHNCNYKNLNYFSDITLADFWGLDKAYPELDDNRGVSLAIVNSSKGLQIIKEIASKANINEVDITKSINGNKMAVTNTKPHINREKFFANIDSKSVDELVRKYVVGNIFNKLIKKIKKTRDKI
jgi:coenzyme F420-reducing hydrogenase beta subunit